MYPQQIPFACSINFKSLVGAGLLMSLAVSALVTPAAFAQGKRTRATVAPTRVTASEAVSPAPGETPIAASSSAAELRSGLRFEAFFDIEARIPNKDNSMPDRGVTLNDAALYLSKDISRATAFIDLPFRYSTSDNNYAFAQETAQTYLRLNHGTVVAKIGQYDTLYGLEQNDSRDRFFAEEGILKTTLIPSTHTGVQVAFSKDNFILTGQIANPNGAGTMGDNNPEFGGQFRLNMPKGYGAFGVAVGEDRNVATSKNMFLFDLIAGFEFDKFKLEGQFDHRKSAGFDKTAVGFGLAGIYAHAPNLDLGLRLEHIKDVPAAAGVVYDSLTQLSFGPSLKFMPDLVFRGDFFVTAIKPGNNVSDETIFGVNVSAVASL